MKLQQQLGLTVDGEKVMIGIISRLVDQKGFDIIAEAMGELMNMDIQLVVVGTGEAKYEICLDIMRGAIHKKCLLI